MSSVQSFPLNINYDNSNNYLVADSSSIKIHYSTTLGGDVAVYTESGSTVTAHLNSAAKALLYPNNSAHPISCDFAARMSRGVAIITSTARAEFFFNATSVQKFSETSTDFKNKSSTGITADAILNSTSNSNIQIGASNTNSKGTRIQHFTITLYFTRYDFSATAGTGVTSASVSSSTGYDGDTVTFSCVIPTGYVFDGWYNGTTLVSSSQSYTHTVNGADLTLTAKAHQNTHSVNGTYNGSTNAILTGVTGDVGVSYNGKTKTMPTDGTEFSLGETNKAMHTDVVVGSAAPLQCAEKLMRSPLVIKYV